MTMQEQMTAIRQRALQPRATQPVRLGAFTPVDTTARYFGVDRKTLLLLGLAGLVGGYLLNDALKATRRTLKRAGKRTRSLATPKNLAVIGVAGLGLGAAYWYFRRPAASTALRAQPRRPS